MSFTNNHLKYLSNRTLKKLIKCNDLRVLAHPGLHHTKPYKAWLQKNAFCCHYHYHASQLLSFAKFLSFAKPFFVVLFLTVTTYFTDRRLIVQFLPKLVSLLVALHNCRSHAEQDHSNCYWTNFPIELAGLAEQKANHLVTLNPTS